MIFSFVATLDPYHLKMGCRTSLQLCRIVNDSYVSTVTKWFVSVSSTLKGTGSQKVEKNFWTMNISLHHKQDFTAWTAESLHTSHHYCGNLFVDHIEGANSNYTPDSRAYSKLVPGHVGRQINKSNGRTECMHADAERN